MCSPFTELALDMNHDGVFTYRDLLLILAWLYYYPGDWLALKLFPTPSTITRFLELAILPCHSLLAALMALASWAIFLTTSTVCAIFAYYWKDFVNDSTTPPTNGVC